VSSHHIVREKQEPALLIMGMDTFDQELLGQLLEWSPTVIATYDTAEKLTSLGIKVDRIVAEGDAETLQSDVKFIFTNDRSVIETTLNLLIAENYGAVNVVTDEFDLKDFEPFAPNISLVILHQQQKTYPVSSGFTKWLPADEVITLHSHPQNLITSGLSLVEAENYITIADGVIKLEFADSFIFISETV
jgi:thiamine pyrophosphokinase